MLFFKKLYENSPIFLQNIACTIRGCKEKKSRLGGIFSPTLNFLKESEFWDKYMIERYQTDKMKELIQFCYNNIPYYKELFDKISLNPIKIQSLEDLKRIPVLTKEDVRIYYNKLINPNYKEKVFNCHTSGSTGKSLQFLFSEEAVQYRWALWFRHRHRFGVGPNDPYATFTGQIAVPLMQLNPPYWRENRAMKQTIFTMHHINETKVPDIVNRLNKGGFIYYSGYPSIIFSLACIIEDLGLKITKYPKVIFTGAETLLDYQKNKISSVFHCLVTDQYGFSEGCGNASRCEKDLFHEDFEYGILEYDNEKVNSDGSITGEILATGFTNFAMPFIRYKVGDTATWIDSECECGRKSKIIININGRNEDFIITPEGNKILRFDYIFKDTHNIIESQIIQRELGSIIIRIIKRNDFSKLDEELLKKEVHNKISPKLNVYFEYPLKIERERTGKFRAVKSYLNNESTHSRP